MTHPVREGALALALLLMTGCATVHRFPLAEPVRVADDRAPLTEELKETYSPPTWDAIDQSIFSPISRALSVHLPGRAKNANTWDEVPDSSWFTNRIGIEPLTPEQLAQGPCPETPVAPDTEWTVVSAKADGADPGFVIEAAGERYVVKLDRASNPERGTTADVVSSRFYWAAGFDVPCNRIVYFDPSAITIADDATAKDRFGRKLPLTREMLDEVLARAELTPQGTYRANASLFLPGEPIGPWHYEGRKKDDPNDTIPHDDRREVRASRLLGAWFDHIDARSQNTLMMLVEDEDGGTHAQHHIVDFGDNFGFEWRYAALSRRLGHQTGFHVGTMLVDWLSLGTVRHPWDTPHVNEAAPLFRDYDTEHFDPVGWRAGYTNPAFNEMDDADAAWMARILARFDDELIEAAVAQGQLSDPAHERELVRVIKGRRDMLLDEWLRRVSPLGRFSMEDGASGASTRVCFTDVAAEIDLYPPTTYFAHGWFGAFEEAEWSHQFDVDAEARACVDLGAMARPAVPPTAPPDDPARYTIVELSVTALGADGRLLPPARLHLYDQGADGFSLVAIDRPTRAQARRPILVPSSHRPGEAAAWVPRVVLAPAYAVHEFLVRAPVGAVATAFEKHNVSAHIQRILTFGTGGRVGILPTFLLDFGTRPSVGATLFVHQARRARFTAHFGYGGKGWLVASARQRIKLGPVDSDPEREGTRNQPWRDSQVFFGFRYHRQPDYIFMGMGSEHRDALTRFSDREVGGDVGVELNFGTLDGLRVRGVVEHHALSSGYRSLRRPQASIEDVFDVADPKAVPGWGDYWLAALETTLHLDSRKTRPAGGSGLGLEVRADLGFNPETRRSGFLRWGGEASAWLDVSGGGNRVLSLHQAVMLVTPLDTAPIPFTEQISLGGFDAMRGFRPGALRGASSLVTTLQYEWPVWAYLDALIFVEAGNTFDSYLRGFHPADLRLSTGTGFRTTGDRDAGFYALVGFGTTPLGRGDFGLDSVRLTVGFDRAF